MPNIQSAKKALRQNARHKLKNTKRADAYKRAIKDYKKLVAGKKKDEAEKMLPKVFQALDKAAKANVIKKNKANRLKSRIAVKVK